MNAAAAIYDVLAGDGSLVAHLSTYKGSPAIFSADPVPKDAVAPWVVISGAETDDDFGAKNEEGREVVRRIRVYDDAEEGSVVRIDIIAERIRDLLHRRPFSLSGGTVYLVDVQGPLGAPSGPDLYGRALVVRFAVGPPPMDD